MERTTKSQLESLVAEINTRTNHKLDPYNHSKPGCNPNTGTYLLDYAYGGVRLSQMSLTKGCTGQSDITQRGTKTELYYQLKAILIGLDMQKA